MQLLLGPFFILGGGMFLEIGDLVMSPNGKSIGVIQSLYRDKADIYSFTFEKVLIGIPRSDISPALDTPDPLYVPQHDFEETKICTCDLYTVILRTGCRCGGK